MKTFKQTHLTKRFLAIILSLIFALSSFTIAGFVPSMDAQASTRLNVSGHGVVYNSGDSNRYGYSTQSGVRVGFPNIVNDGQTTNHSVLLMKFDISSLQGYKLKDSSKLRLKVFRTWTNTNNNTSYVNNLALNVYYSGSTTKPAYIGNGTTYNSTFTRADSGIGSGSTGISTACRYLGFSESNLLGSIPHSNLNYVDFDIAPAINDILDNGGDTLYLLVGQNTNDGTGGAPWSDTELLMTEQYIEYDAVREVSNNLVGQWLVNKDDVTAPTKSDIVLTNNGTRWAKANGVDAVYFDGKSSLTANISSILNNISVTESTTDKNDGITISFATYNGDIADTDYFSFSALDPITTNSDVVGNRVIRHNTNGYGRISCHSASDWNAIAYAGGGKANSNEWTYWTITVTKKQEAKIYKNGVKTADFVKNPSSSGNGIDVIAQDMFHGASNSCQYLGLGASPLMSTNYTGYMRDFRIYNVGFEADDVAEIYNDMKQKADATVSYTESEVESTIFDVKNTTAKPFSNTAATEDVFSFTDPITNVQLKGIQWSATKEWNNTDGYIKIDNATLSTPNDFTAVGGKKYSVSMKYYWDGTISNNADKSETIFGLGGSGSTANILFIKRGGNVYIANTKIDDSLNQITRDELTCSNNVPKTIKFEYNNGTATIYINGVSKATYQVPDDVKTRLETGVQNLFVGTSARNYAGGNWVSATNDSNNGGQGTSSIHGFSFYNLVGVSTTLVPDTTTNTGSNKIPDPEVTPSETDSVITYDTKAIDDAMKAFADKLSDGNYYKNIKPAYDQYVICQKLRDAVVYGHDESKVDSLAGAATILNGYVNNMTKFEYPTAQGTGYYYNQDSGAKGVLYTAQTISSRDGDGVGLYLQGSSNCVGWTKIVMPTYTVLMYDGVTTPQIPMAQDIRRNKDVEDGLLGVACWPNDSRLSFVGDWKGYYTNNSSTNYENTFTLTGTHTYKGSSSYTDNKNLDGQGANGWARYWYNMCQYVGTGDPSRYYETITEPKFSFRFYGSNSQYGYHTYDDIESHGTIYVINYKALRDNLTTNKTNNINKLKDIKNYSEGGAAYFINSLNYALGINPNSYSYNSNVATYVSNCGGDIGSAITSLTAYNASTATSNSSAYAALRTALDACTITSNDKCYSGYDAYITALKTAREAMKAVYTSGYSATNIQSLANDLNTKREALVAGGEHIYSNTGTINMITKKVEYKCLRCPDDATHTDKVDAEAYMSAVETFKAEIAKSQKYTEASRKEAQAELEKYGLSEDGVDTTTGSEVCIAHDSAISTINSYTEAILSALTTLKTPANLNNINVTYQYQKDSDPVGTGDTVTVKYGDLVVENGYTLGKGEYVKQWKVEYEDGQTSARYLSYNPTTTTNFTATQDATITCYIDSEKVEEKPYTIQFIDSAKRVRAIAYAAKGDEISFNGTDILVNSQVVYTAEKIPMYTVHGFKIANKDYDSSTSYTVNGNVNVYTSYSESKPIKITLTGEYGDKIINGTAVSSLKTNIIDADWDEKITIEDSSTTAIMYWFIDNVLVGVGRSFTFRANQSCTVDVQSKYTFSAEEKAQVEGADGFAAHVKADYFKYDVSLNKVTAVVTFGAFAQNAKKDIISYNDNFTEAGVILSTTASDAESIKKVGKKFASNTFTDAHNQVKITVSRTATTSFKMYALPYAVINGKTFYGNVAVCSYPEA